MRMADEPVPAGRSADAMNARGLGVKRDLVRALEQRADAESLAELANCLCDESPYLRELAEEAFLRLAERGAGSLRPLLSQGLWFTRTSAARVLGRLGDRAAAPALLRLADDSNATVAEAAREALSAIGHQRGAGSIAHALHRAPPDLRRRRLDDLAARDRVLHERIERLMLSNELMSVEDGASLSDDLDRVQASEAGAERAAVAAPPSTASPGAPGSDRAGAPR
jgi:HEAT repeat protein